MNIQYNTALSLAVFTAHNCVAVRHRTSPYGYPTQHAIVTCVDVRRRR